MGWRYVLAAALVTASSAAAGEVATERQKLACRLFSKSSDGLLNAIDKQRSSHEGSHFSNLASDLPAAAAEAARQTQVAEIAAEAALKKLQERIEDFNYQLKLCAR